MLEQCEDAKASSHTVSLVVILVLSVVSPKRVPSASNEILERARKKNKNKNKIGLVGTQVRSCIQNVYFLTLLPPPPREKKKSYS